MFLSSSDNGNGKNPKYYFTDLILWQSFINTQIYKYIWLFYDSTTFGADDDYGNSEWVKEREIFWNMRTLWIINATLGILIVMSSFLEAINFVFAHISICICLWVVWKETRCYIICHLRGNRWIHKYFMTDWMSSSAKK